MMEEGGDGEPQMSSVSLNLTLTERVIYKYVDCKKRYFIETQQLNAEPCC
jgi:hypothetical protein